MIVHISGDSFKRILLQVVQNLDFIPVPQMNHHIGVIAKFGAQGFEFVCCFAEMSVGHYNYFHCAWHAIPNGVPRVGAIRLEHNAVSTLPGFESANIAISCEKTSIFNPGGLGGWAPSILLKVMRGNKGKLFKFPVAVLQVLPQGS